MDSEQTFDDVRVFNGDIINKIEYLFDITSYCETNLNVKITMGTPGRIYTKVRDFKFNFNYLFSLSSKRSEIDANLKENIRTWLDIPMPVEDDNETIEIDYIKAGLKLFSHYGDELSRIGVIVYKRT